MVPLRVRPGTRVRFAPTPVSLALYSRAPTQGATGRVTTVPLGGSRRSYLAGPGGGLVYVAWDDGSFQGVSPNDLERVRMAQLEENPSGATWLVGAVVVLGGFLWWASSKKKTTAAPPASDEKPFIPITPVITTPLNKRPPASSTPAPSSMVNTRVTTTTPQDQSQADAQSAFKNTGHKY